jgi:hypothetical protein
MSLNREFLILKEQGRGRERGGGWVGQQAVIFKVWVRFERDRVERQRERDMATKRRRERADNKNPEQSWVAQLVFDDLIDYAL